MKKPPFPKNPAIQQPLGLRSSRKRGGVTPFVASRSAAKTLPARTLPGRSNWAWRRVSTKALVEFTRSFAVMIGARLSLVQSLETAAAQCGNLRLKGILETVRRDVQHGNSLSDSLAKYPTVFSPLFIHLTKIGEVAGILDVVLLRLATHLEKAAALRRKIQYAMFYPALILTVAAIAIVFFLTALVPTFAEMYADFGQQLPLPTQIVLQISDMVTTYFLPMLLVLGSIIIGIMMLLNTQPGRLGWDRVKLRLPLLGRLLQKSLTARFCRTLGTMLSSGVALVDALAIQSKASGNAYVEQGLEEVLKSVRRGNNLYLPLAQLRVFPTMVVQLIAVGEQTAELDTMLLHAADHYEHEVDGLLEGLTSIIEPILIVCIGLILGGILVSLYLPMFELLNTIG